MSNATRLKKNHEPLKQEAARLLKSVLVREGVTLEQLSLKLSSEGVHVSPSSLSGRISGGAFNMAFFMLCMRVLGKQIEIVEK